MNEAQNINVQLIDRPNPPVRLSFNEEEIQALVESIRTEGILVPLLVRPRGERFEIIDGDCRLEAAVRLRLREVPCMVRNSTDSETHVLRILANLNRSNPDPVSEAIYVAKVIASGAHTRDSLAAALKHGPEWIDDRLAIAAMPPYMQDALQQKKIPLGVALALAEVDDDFYRERYLNSAIVDGMSVRSAQDCVRQYFRLKDLQTQSENPADAPPIPETPPVLLYSCAKCGRQAPLIDFRLVRVCKNGCPGIDIAPEAR